MFEYIKLVPKQMEPEIASVLVHGNSTGLIDLY